MGARWTDKDIKGLGIHVTPDGKGRKLDTGKPKKKLTEKDIQRAIQKASSKKEKREKQIEPITIVTNGVVQVNIKPLSVNEAWKGQRFKTDEYKDYQKLLWAILPKSISIPKPPFHIFFEFGFSNIASDWDNPVKPLQDTIAEMYGFNDKQIRKATVSTEIVHKGEEYIKFEIKTMYETRKGNL